MFKKILSYLLLACMLALPLSASSQSFVSTFGGSPVSPASVAFASYSFSTSQALYWPNFANGQPNVAARFMNIATTASNLNIALPDATLASVGYDTIIFNNGVNNFNVVNYNNGAIVTIAPNQTYYILLNANATQAGTWQTVQFGVGTGSAVASALAGPGLEAYAGLLQVNLNANNVSSNFTLTYASLAQFYVWTGGSGTITIPSAASVGNGFFFMVANNGSGNLLITPASGTIDGNMSSSFAQSQSGFIMSNGTNWYTVGKGIQNTFSVTLLNLNVSGSSNVTETSAQAQNIIQQYTGTLTGNISVIVPATVQWYEVNNMTSGAYTLTVKTASGTGIVVPSGQTSILYCDGTNVINGLTASVTATFSLTNGSASSPSLYFQNYPTTGIFLGAANAFSIGAGANEVMRFTSQASSVNYFGAVASASGSALALGAAGTDTNININIVPKGSGTVTLGSLDGTIIGANTPESATFTTLIASQIGSSSINNTPIGTITPSTGSFTTLSASSTVSGSGFSTYLASPPPIGTSSPNSGEFSSLSVGTSQANGYALNVQQAGGNQAYFSSTGSNSAGIVINNAAGSQQSGIIFEDAGAQKWQILKQTDQSFELVDEVNTALFLKAVAGGTLSLGAAQNVYISQTGNFSIGGTGNGTPLFVTSTSNNQGWFQSTGAFQANVVINAPSGENSVFTLANNGLGVWTFYNNGSAGNDFNLQDTASGTNIITATSGGTMWLGEAQNLAITSSGVVSFGAHSIGTNGYTTITDGVFLQFGQGSTSSGTGSVSLPKTCPNALLSFTATIIENNANSTFPIKVTTYSASTVNVANATGVSENFFWTAVCN